MKSGLLRYGFAVAVVALATAASLTLGDLIAPMRLLLLWVAILATAVMAGVGPALVATALAVLSAAYFLFTPTYSFDLTGADLARLVLFTLFASALAGAVGLRRQAEQKAQTAREWLSTTLASIGDAVIATDRDGAVTLLNPKAEELTGWSTAEAKGKPLSEIFALQSEETGEPVHDPVRRVLDTGQVVALANHTALVQRDGGRISIDDSAAPIRDAEGRVLGVVLVFHDVTARRRLEKQVRESEARYRTLVEATPVAQAVWTASPDGRVEWSDAWLEITGQSREELEAGGGLATVHPDDVERTSRLWSDALAHGSSYEDEIRVRTADGRYRWFAIRAVPRRDEGERVCEWVGVVADIDQRKRQEALSRFTAAASELLGSSLDYQNTLSTLARLSIPELGDWCAVYVAQDDGYELLAVEHQQPERAAFVREVDRRFRPPSEIDPVMSVLRSGSSQIAVDVPQEQLRLLAASEEHARIIESIGVRSWIIAPMIARGRTLGAVAVVMAESGRRYDAIDLQAVEDLARRAAMAVDNARLYEEAEAASRAKDEFLATLSHELRTPLTAVVGWASMLRDGELDPETNALAIDTIVRSARSQAELIDELLDLSRAIAGKLDLAVRPVDLASLVQQTVVAARPAADARRIYLRAENAAQPAIVHGDERRLRQVLWNLVTNAVKFTEPGGAVTVRLSCEADHVQIDVSDTGHGIDPAFLPFVWERFRQADSSTSRQYGGLGLGLAVTKQLVEAHGGSVSVMSEGLGTGSTFTVRLPLQSDTGEDRQSAGAVDARKLLEGKRLLVVDDEEDARVVIAAMLRQFGADVLTAASAGEALSAMESVGVDAVVTDLAMPREDGFSLLRQIRERSRVPVFALSAIGGTSDERTRVLGAGFADFLRKPVEPGPLAEMLHAHLS